MNVEFAGRGLSRNHLTGACRGLAVGFLLASVGCHDPLPFNAKTSQPVGDDAGAAPPSAPEDCPATAEWLPGDGGGPPPQQLFFPATHPNTECPFYRGGWHNFLIAMQGPNGEPAIASYPTIDDVFTKTHPLAPGALAAPGQHRGTMLRSWLGDIKQAGQRNILVDQHNHTLYYGIHVNQRFVDFVDKNGLQTLDALQSVSQKQPGLFFEEGIVEFKTAWTDIDTGDGISAAENAKFKQTYIWTKAWVPHLTQDATGIEEDKDHPRQIEVALVAVHVVYTFPGHPEFVWTSFQHVDPTGYYPFTGSGMPDSTPSFFDNPSDKDPTNQHVTTVVSDSDFLLYHHGTTAQAANVPIDQTLRLDEASQSFPGQQSSIYRLFPGSKSNSVFGDDAVISLNGNMAELFAANAPTDPRGHYRLLGGTWMDKPQFFTNNSPLQNDPTLLLADGKTPANPLLNGIENTTTIGGAPYKGKYAGASVTQDEERNQVLAAAKGDPLSIAVDDLNARGSDSPFSILAGEDRMSSTSMESFTQSPNSFYNCFQCHNTLAINAHGTSVDRDPTSPQLMPPGLLNVSHVLSQFVLEECSSSPPPASCCPTDGTPRLPNCP